MPAKYNNYRFEVLFNKKDIIDDTLDIRDFRDVMNSLYGFSPGTVRYRSWSNLISRDLTILQSYPCVEALRLALERLPTTTIILSVEIR